MSNQKKNGAKTEKGNSSFNPDEMIKAISQSILRDFTFHGGANVVCPPPITEFFLQQQKIALLKKYKHQGQDNERMDYEALMRLKKTNDRLNSSELSKNFVGPMSPQLRNVLINARRVCHFILSSFTLEELFESAQHSSGATIGTSFRRSNLPDKMTRPLSVTPRCKGLMDLYFQFDQRMLASLRHPEKELYKVVQSCKLSFVDKDDKKKTSHRKRTYLQYVFTARGYADDSPPFVAFS